MTIYFGTGFSAYAQQTADSLGGLEANPISIGLQGTNDQYDAYRHALLAAELTQVYGANDAKAITDAYESY